MTAPTSGPTCTKLGRTKPRSGSKWSHGTLSFPGCDLTPRHGRPDCPVRITPPRCGRSSGVPTKQPAEMSLVAKPARGGQVTERDVAGEHKVACPIDAPLDQIDMGRLAEASSEGAREMRCTQANCATEIRDTDRLRQVLFDEGFQPTDPPRRKSAQANLLVGRAVAVEYGVVDGDLTRRLLEVRIGWSRAVYVRFELVASLVEGDGRGDRWGSGCGGEQKLLQDTSPSQTSPDTIRRRTRPGFIVFDLPPTDRLPTGRCRQTEMI